MSCKYPYSDYSFIRLDRIFDDYSLADLQASGLPALCDPSDLTPPSFLIATVDPVTPQTIVNLNWLDNSLSETGFELHRSTTNNFTPSASTLIVTTSADVTQYQDTGLTASTTYYYRVRAINATDVKYSEYSNQANVTTAISAYALNRAIVPDGLNDYATLPDLDSSVAWPTVGTFYAFFEVVEWPITSGTRGFISTFTSSSNAYFDIELGNGPSTDTLWALRMYSDAGAIGVAGGGPQIAEADVSVGDKLMGVMSWDVGAGTFTGIVYNITTDEIVGSLIDAAMANSANHPSTFNTSYMFTDRLLSARYLEENVGEMGIISGEAFTSTQIADMYNSGNLSDPADIITTGSFLARWKFEDNLTDETGNYPGTAQNGLGTYEDW